MPRHDHHGESRALRTDALVTVAYFDCFRGISGDMILGALLDAGPEIKRLRAALATLRLEGYARAACPMLKGALGGTAASVDLLREEHEHRHLADILTVIAGTVGGEPVSALRITATGDVYYISELTQRLVCYEWTYQGHHTVQTLLAYQTLALNQVPAAIFDRPMPTAVTVSNQ